MTIADVRLGLRAYLLDDANIAAIVGTRVYPVILPQGVTTSSIVYKRISNIGDWHMQGPSGIGRPRIQIDCWSQDADVAANLGLLVKQRLDGYRGTMLWGEDSPEEGIIIQGIFFDQDRDLYENELKMFAVSSDFLVWVSER